MDQILQFIQDNWTTIATILSILFGVNITIQKSPIGGKDRHQTDLFTLLARLSQSLVKLFQSLAKVKAAKMVIILLMPLIFCQCSLFQAIPQLNEDLKEKARSLGYETGQKYPAQKAMILSFCSITMELSGSDLERYINLGIDYLSKKNETDPQIQTLLKALVPLMVDEQTMKDTVAAFMEGVKQAG